MRNKQGLSLGGEKQMSANNRYCIIANPASGPYTLDQRHRLLAAVGDVLKAKIVGLDTTSSDALAGVAREASRQSDVLVVAGGDGTFSLVLNTVDLSQTTLAFLPFGTGNALTHTLAYAGGPLVIARRIHEGRVYRYDLIDCDGRKKAFMASLGIDGTAIGLYERYRALGYRGFKAHLRAGLVALFRDYRPTGAWLRMDGRVWQTPRLLSLMVVKQPYFGMGLKAVPRARWDDGRLHTQLIASGTAGALMGILTGFSIGNRAGTYRAGRRLTVRLDAPVMIQIDGELGWSSDRFGFSVLPGVLRLKH
jgi:diacylglycerol kinase family enzyme